MAHGYAKEEFAAPVWQTWTPTYTNLTVGSGTVIARYIQLGAFVSAHFEFTFGSGSSIDGAGVEVSLPVSTNSNYSNGASYLGHVALTDTGTGNYWGRARWLDADTVLIVEADATGGSNVFDANINASSPFTWTSGDKIVFTVSYEANIATLLKLEGVGSGTSASDDDILMLAGM